jgi:hypothetical protein
MRASQWLPIAGVLAVVCAAPRAEALVHLELEAGGGASARGPTMPVASARVGVDFLDLLTVSVRGQGAFGPDLSGEARRYEAWSVFPELRLRTPTPYVQADLALGVGLGKLNEFTLTQTGDLDRNDTPSPFGRAGLGLRLNIPSTEWFIRAEGGVSIYARVSGPDAALTDSAGYGYLPVWDAQLMLGWRGVGFDLF